MRRLYRERWNKRISGVCGGLGHYLRIDPTIVRILTLFICLFTAVLPVLLIYIVASIVIPLGPKNYIDHPCKKLYRSNLNKYFAGICGGIADFMGVDSTIVRVVVALLTILTGFFPGAFAYIIGSWIIPIRS